MVGKLGFCSRPLSLSVCLSLFSSSYLTTNYIIFSRKHTGDMRYSCDVCGEKFFVHGHMKRHLYSHTGIKPHACRLFLFQGYIFANYYCVGSGVLNGRWGKKKNEDLGGKIKTGE